MQAVYRDEWRLFPCDEDWIYNFIVPVLYLFFVNKFQLYYILLIKKQINANG